MIVVFGSINLDFVTRVARIPAAGETVLGPRYATHPGGKGANQALAACRAGAAVAMVGAVGQDDFAGAALRLLAAGGVDLTAVRQVDAPTGAAFVCVDANGDNAIVVAAGANGAARGEWIGVQRLTARDTLVLQREVPDGEGEAAGRLAREQGARVILNLAPGGAVAESFLRLVDVLVMNETEVAALGAAVCPAVTDEEAIAAVLAQRFELVAVVTLGAAGAVALSAGGTRWRARPPSVEVVDTTAAGDAFVGALAAALDRGRDFDGALAEAVAAGSLACTTDGAQPSLPNAASISTFASRVTIFRGTKR